MSGKGGTLSGAPTGAAETRPQHIARALVWRYLLPAPAGGAFRRLVLLGGTESLAEWIVEYGIADEVVRSLPSGRTADAVVRLHRATEDVLEAAACLAPGGVLYAEVRRAHRLERPTAPHRVQRALEGAGLSGTRLYWCKPDLETRKMFIPLAAPGAVRWFLRSASAATSLRQQLERAVLCRLAGSTRRFGDMVNAYAVTAVQGTGHHAALWDVLPRELRRPDLHALVIGPGSRTVVLPFEGQRSTPVAAAKISPARTRNETTETEQRNLAAVYGLLDGAMRATLPRPYGCTELDGLAVAIEGVVPGRMLWTQHHGGSMRARAGRGREEVRRVIEWIAQLHGQTELRREAWRESPLGSAAAELCDRYASTLLASTGEQALLEDVRRRSVALADTPLPLVWTHNDLHPNNIYFDGERIAVIDWTAARPGPPIVDVVYFLSKWAASFYHAGDDETKVQSFRRMFSAPAPDDPLVAAAHEALRRYLDTLRIDTRFLPLIIALSRIQNALKIAGKAARYQSVRKRADRDVKYVRALAADLTAFQRYYDGDE